MFNVLPIAFRVFSDGLQNYPQSIILNLDRTVLRIPASATKTLLFTTKNAAIALTPLLSQHY